MNRTLIAAAAAALAVFAPRPAHAWDGFGHSLIARIAWENMTPQARARAIAILRGAPRSSGLLEGVPSGGTLSPDRQLQLFMAAAVWPDEVRDETHPGHRFHRRDRHFVDQFWQQDTDFSAPRPLDRPPAGDLLNDVPGLRAQLAGVNRGEAAMALAWLVHLVGDIHQPLHGSSRVTPRDRDGDGGGNRFLLGEMQPRNLHSMWDGVITHGNRRRPGESADAFMARVAREIATRHPKRAFARELVAADFQAWADEGLRVAQQSVYKAPLQRGRPVPDAYRRQALTAAEPRVALAGYRLAELLNAALR